MFNSIIPSSGVTPVSFFACLGVALVLGIIAALVHARTSRSSSNFITTIAILPILVAMAIMLVNGNVGTGIATVGIFSLVRFRSIAGNSKSLLSVFFAMAIGLACGAGYIIFAMFFTIIVALIILVLHYCHFGVSKTNYQKLVVLIPEDLDYTDAFDDVFSNFTKSHILEKVKTTNMGSLFELKYSVALKPNVNEKTFIDKIRVKNGNLKVSLSHVLEDEEL